MPPIWVGFWVQNSLKTGPFFGRFSLIMGGFSKIGIKCFSRFLLVAHGRNLQNLIFTDQSDGE